VIWEATPTKSSRREEVGDPMYEDASKVVFMMLILE
jgi:hypothetical protein